MRGRLTDAVSVTAATGPSYKGKAVQAHTGEEWWQTREPSAGSEGDLLRRNCGTAGEPVASPPI